MKTVVGICLFGLALSAQAAPLTIQPKAGQWLVTTKTMVNGKDIGPQLALIKNQVAAFLSDKQKETLNRYDPSQFTMCLSSSDAAMLSDPEKNLQAINDVLGQCDLQLTGQTANSMSFSGYCTASTQGIEGEVTGQITYHSDTNVTAVIEGVGKLPMAVQLLLVGRSDSTVQLNNQFAAHWEQAQCQSQ